MMGPEEIRGFLEGYFDGDGGGLILNFTSINTEMLEYIRKLLEKQGVRTSLPVIHAKARTVKNRFNFNNDLYIIYIHPLDYNRFTDVVSTCIPRKQHLIELSKKP